MVKFLSDYEASLLRAVHQAQGRVFIKYYDGVGEFLSIGSEDFGNEFDLEDQDDLIRAFDCLVSSGLIQYQRGNCYTLSPEGTAQASELVREEAAF